MTHDTSDDEELCNILKSLTSIEDHSSCSMCEILSSLDDLDPGPSLELFSCEECDSTFPDFLSLVIHVRSHGEEDEWVAGLANGFFACFKNMGC